jgi:4-hydroxybenzoate polyprenyltransferase
MEKIENLITLMRPKQWFKSFYIILGSIPAILLMPARFDLITIFLFAGFLNMVLLQGVMYVTNDIADVEKDRIHPKKKNRPIASGAVSVREATVFGILLFCSALVLASFLDFRIVLIDLALFFNNILYSFRPVKLKDIPYVDMGSAALNFPLRVMVGWYLFEPYNQARLSFSYNFVSTKNITDSIQSILLNASPRIIDFSIKFSTITLSFISIMSLTYFFAIFLLSLKRLAEKLMLKNAGEIRKSLKYYTTTKLKLIAIFSATIVFISLAFLAWSLKPALVVISPFILLMMYWYYRLAFSKDSVVTAPEEIFAKIPKFTLMMIVICIFALIILLL